MQSMDSALAQLVREGKITRQLAEERASVPEELARLMGSAPTLAATGEDGTDGPVRG